MKLVTRILIGFFVLYMAASFLLLGLGLHYLLEKMVPEHPPINVINRVFIYYLFVELLFRYFLQQLPVTDIRNFLLLPIPKRRVIMNVLFKITFSLYNLVPILIFLPFSIVSITKGASSVQMLLWWLGVLLMVLSINFLSFLINKTKWIYPVTAIVFWEAC